RSLELDRPAGLRPRDTWPSPEHLPRRERPPPLPDVRFIPASPTCGRKELVSATVTKLPIRYPAKRGGQYYFEGESYPAVTTVLQEVAKPALMGWYAKLAAEHAYANPGDSLERATG